MKQTKDSQSGQTLVETIVAIYILLTALTVGLGLAVFAVSTSNVSKNQIIAANLAREGLEVARLMRDSNWLSADYDGNADDFNANPGCSYPTGSRPCYPDAFHSPFDLESYNNSSQNDFYRAEFNPASTAFHWALDRRQQGAGEHYVLCLQADGAYMHNNVGNSGVQCDAGNFARRVSVKTGSTSSPFTSDASNPSAISGHSPEKLVTSTVIWMDRGCPVFPLDVDPEAFDTNCKIVMVERLTNWKDYR